MRLPKHIEDIIYAFAAYFPAPWVPVLEHYKGDYGFVPQVAQLVDLPMW